jgi:hypothetical protein
VPDVSTACDEDGRVFGFGRRFEVGMSIRSLTAKAAANKWRITASVNIDVAMMVWFN